MISAKFNMSTNIFRKIEDLKEEVQDDVDRVVFAHAERVTEYAQGILAGHLPGRREIQPRTWNLHDSQQWDHIGPGRVIIYNDAKDPRSGAPYSEYQHEGFYHVGAERNIPGVYYIDEAMNATYPEFLEDLHEAKAGWDL